ncbi:MAG TPA: hypothetical protein PLM33_01220 [Acidobacteriota bacterium]|nr:hypothetical protein [Acidobacteriota bacterium]
MRVLTKLSAWTAQTGHMQGPHSVRGFSFLSLLLVVLIIGVLWWWVSAPTGSSPPTAKEISNAQAAAAGVQCFTNRQAAAKEIMLWETRHPGQEASLEALERSGQIGLGCPEGGHWSIEHGTIRCSIHSTQ